MANICEWWGALVNRFSEFVFVPITLLVLAASCVRLSDSYTHLESYSPADTEVLKEFALREKAF